MDATLAWTVVGSSAGVAGVAVAVVAAITQSRPRRRKNQTVTAESGIGQLDKTGVLYVTFASGKANITTLHKPEGVEDSPDDSPGERPLEFTPVIAIFVHNEGPSRVTISRCQYSANLDGVGFVFEPQSGASERGDHLPKHLPPGDEAVLVHNLETMRLFLNQVLLDYGVQEATFQIVLTLGSGKEVAVSPSVHIQADMCEHEIAAFLTERGGTLVRQELPPSTPPRLTTKRWQWWRRIG